MTGGGNSTKPTAAVGHIPFPHRNMAQVIAADKGRRIHRGNDLTTQRGGDRCDYCYRIGHCIYKQCPIRNAA